MTPPAAAHPRRWRRLWRGAGVAYLVALHALVLVLVFKTDFMLRAGKTLGWIPPEERTVALYESLQELSRRALHVPDGAVIVLGDSIMAGLNPSEIGPDVRIFATGGLTSITQREFLPSLPPLRKARAVIIGIGTNDLKYRPRDLILGDQRRLLAQFPPEQPLVLLATLPVRESNPAVRSRAYLRNSSIRELNKGLRALCAERPDCHFLDTEPVMADRDGQLADEFQAGDGWHLSVRGSQRLATAIRTVLDSVRPSP